MKLLLLLVLFQVASSVKHTLRFFVSAMNGFENLPDFVGVAMVDGVPVGQYDSIINTTVPKQAWMEGLFEENPEHKKWYALKCFTAQEFFSSSIFSLKVRLNHTGDSVILQRMSGCEWDDETGEVVGFNQYGYNGEDFIALDLETLTWVAPTQQAVSTKHRWDTEKTRLEFNKYFCMEKCPELLRTYLHYGKTTLQRTEPPSVSLLQKSPSSPVSCFATGFYPNRAAMFWRKDGEELHEDVDLGEILPNHDGTFQMAADLNVTSIPAEEWEKYDCVFHLSGAKDLFVTKLDKTAIKTNWVHPARFAVPLGAGLAGLLLLAVAITGFLFYRRAEGDRRRDDEDPGTQNPVTQRCLPDVGAGSPKKLKAISG
ncbi:major histocompatibility complex class I-related gene protein-like [Aulostomus maculatus]